MSNVNEMSVEELERVLTEKKQKRKDTEREKREAYESIRAELIQKIRQKVHAVGGDVQGLFDFILNEVGAFIEVINEYGQVRRQGQSNFTITDDTFKIIVKTNNVKGFDERADVAATRLMEFLGDWIKKAKDGIDNPMYQLAMTMLERNRYGDLDYKSVSKLYALEDKFNDTEYSGIMQLFKESNTVERTATNYYFEERDARGVWRRIEISFNRL